MNPFDVAARLLDLVLFLVPTAVAEQLLSEAAIRRANAIANAAEAAKFPGETP